MAKKTLRPADYVLERVQRIKAHLEKAHPHRPQSDTDAVSYATWYVDVLLTTGKLTQEDLRRGAVEAKL